MSEHARELPGLLETSQAHREVMAKVEESTRRKRETEWTVRKNLSDILKQINSPQAGYLSDTLSTACMGEPMARVRVLHELEQLGVVFPPGKGTKG